MNFILNKKNILIKLSIASLIVLVLSAFGCKNEEETPAEEETVEPTEEISFTPPEPTATNEAAEATTTEGGDATTTDEIVFPDTTEETADSDTEATEGEEAAEPEGTADMIDTQAPEDTTTPTTEDSEEATLLRLASTLSEILGTFTNKDREPYKNLKDLKQYSSEKMQGWIDSKTSGAATSGAEPFYGITTRAISSGVLESSANSYKILVTCEREEIAEVVQTPKTFYQLLEMHFIKEGEDWLLDGAYWK